MSSTQKGKRNIYLFNMTNDLLNHYLQYVSVQVLEYPCSIAKRVDLDYKQVYYINNITFLFWQFVILLNIFFKFKRYLRISSYFVRHITPIFIQVVQNIFRVSQISKYLANIIYLYTVDTHLTNIIRSKTTFTIRIVY